MERSSLTSDLIGFFLGFFLGCCGLLLAVFWERDYLRGVIAGILAQIGLQIVAGFVSQASNPVTRIPFDGAGSAPFPWELVVAFGIATVFVVGTIAGALWAFGGGSGDDDDDEDDEPPPPQDTSSYVTFSR